MNIKPPQSGKLAAKIIPLTPDDEAAGTVTHIHVNGLCVRLAKVVGDDTLIDVYAIDLEKNIYRFEHSLHPHDTQYSTINRISEAVVTMQATVYMHDKLEKKEAGINVCH